MVATPAPYPHLKKKGENLAFSLCNDFCNTNGIYITIPHILQNIRDGKKKRKNPKSHIGCNVSKLV